MCVQKEGRPERTQDKVHSYHPRGLPVCKISWKEIPCDTLGRSNTPPPEQLSTRGAPPWCWLPTTQIRTACSPTGLQQCSMLQRIQELGPPGTYETCGRHTRQRHSNGINSSLFLS